VKGFIEIVIFGIMKDLRPGSGKNIPSRYVPDWLKSLWDRLLRR